MAGALQFGIIRIGQIWCVMSPERYQLGFPTRDQALAAAEAIVGRHRDQGAACEILVQDEFGRLAPLPEAAF